MYFKKLSFADILVQILGFWVLLKSVKAKIALDSLAGKEDFIQEECNRRETVNSTSAETKAGSARKCWGEPVEKYCVMFVGQQHVGSTWHYSHVSSCFCLVLIRPSVIAPWRPFKVGYHHPGRLGDGDTISFNVYISKRWFPSC